MASQNVDHLARLCPTMSRRENSFVYTQYFSLPFPPCFSVSWHHITKTVTCFKILIWFWFPLTFCVRFFLKNRFIRDHFFVGKWKTSKTTNGFCHMVIWNTYTLKPPLSFPTSIFLTCYFFRLTSSLLSFVWMTAIAFLTSFYIPSISTFIRFLCDEWSAPLM